MAISEMGEEEEKKEEGRHFQRQGYTSFYDNFVY